MVRSLRLDVLRVLLWVLTEAVLGFMETAGVRQHRVSSSVPLPRVKRGALRVNVATSLPVFFFFSSEALRVA